MSSGEIALVVHGDRGHDEEGQRIHGGAAERVDVEGQIDDWVAAAVAYGLVRRT